MKPFSPLVCILLAAATAFIANTALADQHQSQSGDGPQLQMSSGTDKDEADYRVWKHGHGKVHKLAKVDASAEVGPDAKVGPHVVVEAGAKIEKSLLMGSDAQHPLRVGKGAEIEGTTIQGPFDIKAGIKIHSCQLSGMGPDRFKIDADMSGEMAMYPRMDMKSGK
jgi:UDP-3-O-[3-hydroxymyristoyl] glucosamine N-acyltransferase